MNWAVVLTVFASVAAAIIAALLAYANNVRMHQREEAIERLSRQLRDLYGPLLALSSATYRASNAFLKEHRPSGGIRRYLKSNQDPADEVAVAYRLWLTEVLMPRNREMVAVVLRSADLLEEDALPNCLLDLIAHVSGYEAVLKQWENANYSRYWPLVDFPGAELHDYAQHHFIELKQRQTRYLETEAGWLARLTAAGFPRRNSNV